MNKSQEDKIGMNMIMCEATQKYQQTHGNTRKKMYGKRGTNKLFTSFILFLYASARSPTKKKVHSFDLF